MRIIPRKTNVKIEIVKNVTLGDIIFGMIGVAGALGFFLSNFASGLNYWIGIAWCAIIISLFFKISISGMNIPWSSPFNSLVDNPYKSIIPTLPASDSLTSSIV